MRELLPKDYPCCICGSIVPVKTVTSPNANAPEMVRLPPTAFIGVVSDQDGPYLVACCGETCVQKLLKE